MLGVGPAASGEEIDRAFRTRLAGHSQVQKLTAARRALQDPRERALVDLFLLDDAVLATVRPDALADPSALAVPARWATLQGWQDTLAVRFLEPALLQTLGAASYWSALHLEHAGGGPVRDQWERAIACWTALGAQDDYWQRFSAIADLRTTVIERLRSRLQDCEQPYRDRGDAAGAALYQELEEALDTEQLAWRPATGRAGPGPLTARLLAGRAGAAAAPAASVQTARVRTLVGRGNPQAAAQALAELPAATRGSLEGRELGADVHRALAGELASLDKTDEALAAWEQALGFGDTAHKPAILAEVAQFCQARAAALQQSDRAQALRVLERGLKIANVEKIRQTLAELVTQDGINDINAAYDAAEAGAVTPELLKTIEKGRRQLQRAAELGSQRAADQLPAAAAMIVRMRWHQRQVENRDFNDLPLHLRQRLTNCITRREEPGPLLSLEEPAPKVPGLAWAGVGLLLFILLLVIGDDWGRNAVGGSQAPGVLVAGYMLPLAGALAIVAMALRRKAESRKLPFRAGRYLFPVGLIDARTRRLRIMPLSRVKKLSLNNQGAHYDLTVQVDDDEGHDLPIFFDSAARQVIDALNQAGTAEQSALQQGDRATLSRLDPLADFYLERQSLTPDTADEARICAAQDVPDYWRWRYAAAAATAIVLAAAMWAIRNYTSDTARFQAVRGHEGGLVAYLRIGGRFEGTARQELDELRYKAAMAAGTEEALLRYLKSGGRHEEAVRKELPAAALRDAKKAGTVAALRAMIVKYPDTPPATEARAEVSRIYDQSLAGFRKQAPDADPRVAPFMSRLLAYLEDHAITDMAVRFEPPTIDAELRATLAGTLGPSDEASVVTRFEQAFSKIFRGDVLKLKHAGRADNAATARREGPLMLIRYNVAAQGRYVLEDRFGIPGRGFTGLRIDFAVGLSTPDSPDVLRFSVSVLPPTSFNVSTSGSLDPSTATVYDTMIARAFDGLHDRLHEVLLGGSAP